ncbi:unnamed protein product [Arabidopsis halleri]
MFGKYRIVKLCSKKKDGNKNRKDYKGHKSLRKTNSLD